MAGRSAHLDFGLCLRCNWWSEIFKRSMQQAAGCAWLWLLQVISDGQWVHVEVAGNGYRVIAMETGDRLKGRPHAAFMFLLHPSGMHQCGRDMEACQQHLSKVETFVVEVKA